MRGIEIRISQMRKEFSNSLKALAETNVTIGSSEFVSILGPSGCGKSTLLKLIAQLQPTSAGEIKLLKNGNPVGLNAAEIGFVFQEPQLLPWRNILENAALPLELLGQKKVEREKIATPILEQLGLKDFLNSLPHQLSGGMRMRVSLARALVTKPDLLLLDEPFGALDEMTRQKLDEDLRKLWADQQMTVIFVTHSLLEAAFIANRCLVMSSRPGRIVLDRQIELASSRTKQLRDSEALFREMQILSRALEAYS